MKQIVELDQLKSRAESVRWTLSDVSLAAGMARSTAYQVVEHKNPKRSTHEALSRALLEEEVRLLRHLVLLHPDLVALKDEPREAAE